MQDRAWLIGALFATILTLMTFCQTSRAQMITPITLEEPPAETPSPAALTRQKLARKGMVDGADASISLNFVSASLGNVLDYIAVTAQGKPHEIQIIIDGKGIEDAGFRLSKNELTFNVHNISLQQALRLVLDEELDFRVQDDGSVIVSSNERLWRELPRRLYDVSEVLAAIERATYVPAAPSPFTIYDVLPPPGLDLQAALRGMIITIVRGREPWDHLGGRATVDFHLRGRIMSVTADDDMQQQVVNLCRVLLAVEKQHGETMRTRLEQAEKELERGRQQAASQRKRLRELYVRAGRDDWQLTRQAIMAEAARQEPGKVNVEELLELADRVEELKADLEDTIAQLNGQRRLVLSLWEKVNGIPPEGPQNQQVDEEAARIFDKALGRDNAAQAPAVAVSDDAAAVAQAGNVFAFDLYARLRSAEGNIFCSPYSISSALAMTWAGARGDTEKEMAKVLHFNMPQNKIHAAQAELISSIGGQPGGPKRSYQLHTVNQLWGQVGYAFNNDYLQVTAKHYRSQLRPMDFKNAAESSRQFINAEIAKLTQDRIKDLLAGGTISDMTRLVLTNAIYFKGSWAVPFEKNATRDKPFTLLDGKQTPVPMMSLLERLDYMKGDGFQALSLDYLGQAFSMVILLPDKSDGLAEFEKLLTAESLAKWLAQMSPTAVQLYLPRFTMEYDIKLKPTLIEMGMPSAFDVERADLSAIAEPPDGSKLFISDAVHKAFVEVNEEGTEAAAATAVIITESAAEEVTTFKADHPFVFLIRHKATGSILFWGRVINPAAR